MTTALERAIAAVALAIHDLLWVKNGHHLCRGQDDHDHCMRLAHAEAEVAITAALPHLPSETEVVHDLGWARRTSRREDT